MKHSLACGVILLATTCLVGLAPEKFDPFPRKAEILKQFVDEFVPLTPGQGKYPATFRMGSKAAASEQPIREIDMKSPFAMARNEVTQELYQVVVGNNPARWKGPRNSIELVTWDEAVAFCEKATELLRKEKRIGSKDTIRLPSEAEWEYACRAGTDTTWSFGDDASALTDYCWYRGNSKGHDPPVGMKKANPWGLFDMHGYNWEWCQDDWSADYKKRHEGPAAHRDAAAKGKVIRSGAWSAPPEMSRSAFRTHAPRDHKDDAIGFRCVRSAE